MDFTFEDLDIKPSNSYVPLIPPVSELADGTLEITDWVKDAELVGFTYENNNAIFTLRGTTYKEKKETLEDGTEKITYVPSTDKGTTRKYVGDPLERPHIQKMDDSNPDKKTQVGYTYNEVISFYKNFVKPFLVDAAVREIKPITLETLSTELYKLMEDKSNHNENAAWLKLAFKNESGVEPKFVVPQNRYVGNEKFAPVWFVSKTDVKYNDKKNFAFEEKTADFATPSMAPMNVPTLDPTGGGIDEVFVATDSTLNTPDVDLLS